MKGKRTRDRGREKKSEKWRECEWWEKREDVRKAKHVQKKRDKVKR